MNIKSTIIAVALILAVIAVSQVWDLSARPEPPLTTKQLNDCKQLLHKTYDYAPSDTYYKSHNRNGTIIMSYDTKPPFNYTWDMKCEKGQASLYIAESNFWMPAPEPVLLKLAPLGEDPFEN